MRIVQSMVIAFAFLIVTVGGAAADTIEVPSVDGPTIQAAVNNASDGDTIVVHPETYTENVVVDKELTIISESGNPDDTIVQANVSSDHVFHVTADNVTISGFNVTGSIYYDDFFYSGIYLENVEKCNVTNNILTDNLNGICLYYSSNNTLDNNNASGNFRGIYFYYSSDNILNKNIASGNSNGIELYSSNYNILINNTESNNVHGIGLGYSNYNKLNNNTANSNNDVGISLYRSSNNELSNNTVNTNNYDGVWLFDSSDNNILSNNTASDSVHGIRVESSSYNKLNINTVSNNEVGIRLYRSSNNNHVYNNFFNNTNNAQIDGSSTGNLWSISKTVGSNIIGGSFLGGNYWATPTGDGFSQTCEDADGDGICDLPYNIDANNTDYLPLTMPKEQQENVPTATPLLTVGVLGIVLVLFLRRKQD